MQHAETLLTSADLQYASMTLHVSSHAYHAMSEQLHMDHHATNALQMERLQLLMRHAKSHGLPVEGSADDSDADDEDRHDRMIGVKAAHERLKSIQELAGSSPGRSPGGLQTPNR